MSIKEFRVELSDYGKIMKVKEFRVEKRETVVSECFVMARDAEHAEEKVSEQEQDWEIVYDRGDVEAEEVIV